MSVYLSHELYSRGVSRLCISKNIDIFIMIKTFPPSQRVLYLVVKYCVSVISEGLRGVAWNTDQRKDI